MATKWPTIGMLISLLLLVSCSVNPEKGKPPGQQWVDEEGQSGLSAENNQETDTPISDTIWEDLTIFSQTLSQNGQKYLNTLPESSLYHITLTIPKEMKEALMGELKVRYFNQESHPLEEVYFRLFPNFYNGSLKAFDIEADGLPLKTQIESGETALRVELAQPLAPGESVIITMKYELKLPETMSGNYGLLGFFDGILVLDTFYPMIPAYADNSWYVHYPYQNGDLTYTDASFYLVEVSAPASLVIVSSGSVVQKTVRDGIQNLKIASGPSRDFFLAGSNNFVVMTEEIDGITINSYAPEEHSTVQELALRYTCQALQVFNSLYGEYPYNEFDVISSPMQALGIEYPGVTGIYLGLYDESGRTSGLSNRIIIESVIAHEVGHQWFYNIVGNDQQSEPWVDESLVQYLTYQYFEQQYGNGAGSGIVQSWNDRWARVDYQKMPIGLIASEYGDFAYSPIVYGRGPLFFLEYEKQFGGDILLKGLQSYIQEHLWEEANTEDIKKSLEAACNCDLTDLFEEWIYPTD